MHNGSKLDGNWRGDSAELQSFNAQPSNKPAILNLIEDLHRTMGFRLPATPKFDAACLNRWGGCRPSPFRWGVSMA